MLQMRLPLQRMSLAIAELSKEELTIRISVLVLLNAIT